MTARAVPGGEGHAALVAGLSARLRMDAGLVAVRGGPVLRDPQTAMPGQEAHAALVADLNIRLGIRIGLTQILRREGSVAGLVEDLSARLDLDRGLAQIVGLQRPVGGIPGGPSIEGRDEEAIASIRDSLLRIQRAADHDRIQLRTAGPHRYLDAAIRAAREILAHLGRMDLHTDLTDTTLVPAADILSRQRTLLAEATAALANALPKTRADELPAPESGPTVSVVLANARRSANITAAELARRVGMSPAKISRIETGRVTPSRVDVRVLGEALNLPAEQIESLVRRQQKAIHEQGAPARQPGSAVGDALRRLRHSARMTSVELSRRVGMSPAKISRIETGFTKVSPEDLARICQALDATPQQIQEIIELGSADWQQRHSIDTQPAVMTESAAVAGTVEAVRDDRSALATADVGLLLRQSTVELDELGGRMADSAGVMSWAAHRNCLELIDEVLTTMRSIWVAISDFRGADLVKAEVTLELEDLDGIQWSDKTALGGRTRWPSAMITVIQEHSDRVPGQLGIWQISLGTVTGPDTELVQMLP